MLSGDAGLVALHPRASGCFPAAARDGNPKSRVSVSARRSLPAAPGSCSRCRGNGPRRRRRCCCCYGPGGGGEGAECRAAERRGGRGGRLRSRGGGRRLAVGAATGRRGTGRKAAAWGQGWGWRGWRAACARALGEEAGGSGWVRLWGKGRWGVGRCGYVSGGG